ncbi:MULTISPECIES: L-aspartate oxidase [unclassified Coleofasciculus]|uniref:L-aspartate oxidase n=2 Tax=unclassified Coleofasciculus TaxID=2692782 RepID=UPI00188145BC|nr:L-aspartate oxidase [Coleofasciculus sp. LEGE 07081]MBE9147850.1 L-aspartate oxidase [Coleofasciculus sp. LEGE 07092]
MPTQFDVLVIGAGAAGLYATLCLSDTLRVGLITKDTLSTGASDWAQGGIAAAIDPKDSPVLHIEDTIKAGAGLCDSDAVQFLVEQAGDCIQSLVEMGVAFDRHGSQLALTLEAAHSRARVLHAADTTGRAVVSTLTALVLRCQNITVLQQAFALSLWINSQTGYCQGVSLMYQGRLSWVQAGAVVLATGGGGQVFVQTTNPEVSTGDGVAMAWRAGAMLRDLEFMQFHPTALTKAGAPHFLISEAVRGEGAHLVDIQGRRFAFDYHSAGELAPRDVVSRAIFNHLQKGVGSGEWGVGFCRERQSNGSGEDNSPTVYLDLRPIPDDRIRHRFPNIIQVCQQWGIDVFHEPIPVAPAAHYWMGGIATDLMTRTSIPGLYAVGETASTGVHGANRLASNSLLECIVFGAQLSKITPEKLAPIPDFRFSISDLAIADWATQIEKIAAIRAELRHLVWQSAGISRSAEGLNSAIAQVEIWRSEFAALPLSQLLMNLTPTETLKVNLPDADHQLRGWGETYNLLDVAHLILKSAAFRTESRGGHYRSDYPHPDPDWQVHTLVQRNQWWKSSLIGTSF